jgi:hypothetical protein
VVSNIEQTVGRLTDSSLTKVIEATPAQVPFWKGRSYRNFPQLLIPRLFWPHKPRWNLWNEYGRTYSILSASDFRTEVVFSYFAEAYMNFGYGWLFLCSALVGGLVALLQRIAETLYGGHSFLAHLCLLMPCLSYQTDLSSLLVKTLYTLILLLPWTGVSRLRNVRWTSPLT